MKCLVCGEGFEGRSDAKYCSPACRLKAHRVGETDNLETDKSVSDETDKSVRVLDLVHDLKLDLHKNLGITAWTEHGIFIRDDITIEQVQNIRALVAAKNGWPKERGFLFYCQEHKQYKPCACS